MKGGAGAGAVAECANLSQAGGVRVPGIKGLAGTVCGGKGGLGSGTGLKYPGIKGGAGAAGGGNADVLQATGWGPMGKGRGRGSGWREC